jgi:hypothetical protein
MARRTATPKAKTKPAPEPEEIEEVDELEDETEVDEEPEPAPKPRRRKAAAKPAPVEDDEDDELDEVEDDEEEAPAKKTGPKRAPIQYGSQWAAEFVNEQAGTQHSAYTLRTLIRQMVKAGAFDRAVGEDRSRYEFSGPKDAKLVAIVKFAKQKASEPKASRTDALEKARAARAANLAAKKAAEAEDSDEDVEETPAPKRRTKAKVKAKPAPVVEEDDADDDFEDLDD